MIQLNEKPVMVVAFVVFLSAFRKFACVFCFQFTTNNSFTCFLFFVSIEPFKLYIKNFQTNNYRLLNFNKNRETLYIFLVFASESLRVDFFFCFSRKNKNTCKIFAKFKFVLFRSFHFYGYLCLSSKKLMFKKSDVLNFRF